MSRLALLSLLACLLVPATAGAAPRSTPGVPSGWEPVLTGLAARGPAGARVETRPRRFEAFALRKADLRAALRAAPPEDSAAARKDPAVISVPAPDGTLERFAVVDSPVLAAAAARRFPEIRTYAGRSLDHPGSTARFDLGPLGFHASVRSDKGTWFVDPYYKGDDGVHVAYYRSALSATRSPLVSPGETDQLGKAIRRAAPRRAPDQAVTRRVYRLALANDPTYATYYGSTDLLVETAKASLMNRVNQLYNDDLAIRMELVGNDYLLNFATNAEYTAEGYTAAGQCDGDRLDENQAAIDKLIKPANYDIGHIVLGLNGGGIAGLGVVGQDDFKAQGCTGVPKPQGDGFAIDYVAHEMGHQFGGPHTFDGLGGSCAPPNRDETGQAAVEPGSGTSIQAYAGICDDDTFEDDLQPNSDPYFSQQSIDDILGYVTSNIEDATEEGTAATVANTNPKVTAGEDKTIPVLTPFTLTGSATDTDGNGLVYLWEQNDSATRPLVGYPLSESATKMDGPLFRVFGTAAVEDPLQSPAPGQNIARAADRVRTFPDPAQIAADDTNAESGTCSDVDCNSEALPSAAYLSGELNFRLTARDRSPVGGGVDHDDVTLALDPTAGPFLVTSPDEPDAPLVGNTTTTVEWDVANTDSPLGVDVQDVRITYSTDGGLTFNYLALASTENDGSADVVVPNLATTRGRFKVEAIDNYFFDVSDGDITVTQGAGATPTATVTADPEPSAAPSVAPLAVPQASATTTATVTASPTPTTSTTATPTPTPTPTPTGGATSTPTAGPSATATASPAFGYLRPGLGQTSRSAEVRRSRRVEVLVQCQVVGVYRPPTECKGSVRLYAKVGGRKRRIGRATFTVEPTATRIVRVRVQKKVYRRLRGGRRLKATVRAKISGRTATRTIKLRR